MAFASGNGRCYRTGKASSINVRHQTNYCLSGEHPSCPFLLKQQAKAEQASAAAQAAALKAEKPLEPKAPRPDVAKKSPAVPATARKSQPGPSVMRKPRPVKSQTAPKHQPAPKSVQVRKPAPKQPTAQPPQKRSRTNLSKISLGLYGVLMTFAMVAVLAWGATLAGADLPAVFAARRTPDPSPQPTINRDPRILHAGCSWPANTDCQ